MVNERAVRPEHVHQLIRILRGHKVILDSDIASLYGVPTKALNRAVTRNLDRFPTDFMFILNPKEEKNLRYQIGTSRSDHGGRRYAVRAFTEQGVAMLSSILRSKRAVKVNIAIMRAFVRIREILTSHKVLARRLDALEHKYDVQFRSVFEAIRQLMIPPEKKKRRIGF